MTKKDIFCFNLQFGQVVKKNRYKTFQILNYVMLLLDKYLLHSKVRCQK